MIKSILDTDLYKFSMSYAYFQLYPLAEGTFKFNDRNKESWKEHPEFIERMHGEIEKLAFHGLTKDECSWCKKNIPYIPETYWEWLLTFRFDISKINYWLDKDGVFQCEVTDKLWKVTFYEIAILATYSEVRNNFLGFNNYGEPCLRLIDSLKPKIELANKIGLPFSEFGTRRRFSAEIQECAIKFIKDNSMTCTGTSNVYFAMKYGFTPQGTCAHEFIMFHAACFGYKRANYLSLEDWIKVYRGSLGVSLIDTFTTKSYLRTLTYQQALLLQGFRQDSGDEREVAEMVIKRLREFKIDPKTKVIVFSNALDFPKAEKLYEEYKDRVKVGFGIGTNITADLGDIPGYNIVMKLSKCRLSEKDPWEKCIKISDDLGKHMGDTEEFEVAKKELHL